jgi:hypothetical protein
MNMFADRHPGLLLLSAPSRPDTPKLDVIAAVRAKMSAWRLKHQLQIRSA